jgi:hypothetical protein
MEPTATLSLLEAFSGQVSAQAAATLSAMDLLRAGILATGGLLIGWAALAPTVADGSDSILGRFQGFLPGPLQNPLQRLGRGAALAAAPLAILAAILLMQLLGF